MTETVNEVVEEVATSEEETVETSTNDDVKTEETEVVEQSTTENTGYVKYRVERAQKAILKQIGVKTVDEAKELIANGNKALEEVRNLQAKLEAEEKARLDSQKSNKLKALLDNESVFDSEALIHYVDLDKVELEDGEIKDSEAIIDSLKKAKPNFFAKYKTVSDSYVKGGTEQPMTAEDKRKSGDRVGAINDYLKEILK